MFRMMREAAQYGKQKYYEEGGLGKKSRLDSGS